MTAQVPLARPGLGSAELAEIAEVLSSQRLTLGPALARFEEAIAQACATNHAVGCANGTAALHLALLALDVGPGDEVVVPAYTFPATANAVVLCGARPVFCDVAPGLDVAGAAEIAAAITPRTRAIMVVHLFGYPAPMGEIMALADDRGIPVVEDAAGALGTLVGGRPAGSFGAAGCLSLHPRKTVTCGEGGAVVTGDAGLAARVRRLRHHGLGPQGFVEVGLNYRLSDILAAVAMPQMRRLDELVSERGRLTATYATALERLDGIEPAPAPTETVGRHSFQAYVARVTAGAAARDGMIAALRDAGVESQVGTYCVPQLAPYRERGYDPEDTPNALAAADAGLALPLHPELRADEVQAVLGALRTAAGRDLAGAAV